MADNEEEAKLPEKQLNKRQEAVVKHKADAKTASGEQKKLKALYVELTKNEAFQDLLAKVNGFAAYHMQVAKDGVAFTQRKSPTGEVIQNTVQLTPEQRTGHLDKAAGIEEITNYVDRMTKLMVE